MSAVPPRRNPPVRALAAHVGKAGKRGECALCKAAIVIGQQIAQLGDSGWVHTACLVTGRLDVPPGRTGPP